MKKIPERKYNLIVDILQKEVPGITDDQIRWLGEEGFQTNQVKDALKTAHGLEEGSHKLEMVINQIERVHNVESSTDEDTKVTSIRLPTPVPANQPKRPDESPDQLKAAPTQTVAKKDYKKWFVHGGAALALVVLGMMLFMGINCLGNDGKNANAAVNQPENSELQAIKSDIATLKTDMSNLGTKVESVNDNTDTLSRVVDSLIDKVGELNTGLGNKAEKSDLAQTNKRVTRLEKKVRKIGRKLDAHLKAGDAVVDPYPDLEPAQPDLPPGKTVVMVCKGGRKCKRAQ